MDIPKIKKRLGDFFLCEEGRISKHSLITIGSFLAGASLFSYSVEAGWWGGDDGGGSSPPPPQCPGCAGGGGTSVPNCEGSCGDIDPITPCDINKILPSDDDYDPDGQAQAYDDSSGYPVPLIDGNGRCSDDSSREGGFPWHYNGADYQYIDTDGDGAEDTLIASHSHHGSHNSY